MATHRPVPAPAGHVRRAPHDRHAARRQRDARPPQDRLPVEDGAEGLRHPVGDGVQPARGVRPPRHLGAGAAGAGGDGPRGRRPRPHPSLPSIDSRTVKAAETATGTGFDPGKKRTGRKRHALVDSLGPAFAVTVTAASVSDADGADSSCRRDTLDADLTAAGAQYRRVIVSELPGQTTFVPQPKRWRVERDFSRLRDNQLLAREYEGRAMISRSTVYLRSVMLTNNEYRRKTAKNAPACAAGRRTRIQAAQVQELALTRRTRRCSGRRGRVALQRLFPDSR